MAKLVENLAITIFDGKKSAEFGNICKLPTRTAALVTDPDLNYSR